MKKTITTGCLLLLLLAVSFQGKPLSRENSYIESPSEALVADNKKVWVYESDMWQDFPAILTRRSQSGQYIQVQKMCLNILNTPQIVFVQQ